MTERNCNTCKFSFENTESGRPECPPDSSCHEPDYPLWQPMEVKGVDVFTEKLFCLALLQCGTDIAQQVLNEYLRIRDDEEAHKFITTLSTSHDED